MEVVSRIKKDYIMSLLQQGKRIDGRAFDQFRSVSVEKGIIQTANGSALVKMGATQVLVGVKIGKGEPFPDQPEEGILVVNAELLPLASPTFEPGPPDEDAIELARVVDRGIRESKCLELEKMAIVPGEEVWTVFIDIYVLDHDGNLIDASALAAIAALTDTKPPADEAWKLQGFPLRKYPVAVTFAKIGDQLLLDPNLEEEQVMDARLTMAFTEDGALCAMQKGGKGYFTREEVERAFQIARQKSAELRRLLGVG
ncbi:MAG: exosome complex protein Rrp42 [Candidatus Hadarchaeales archaeon]